MKIKKVLSFFLAACLLISVMAPSAFAVSSGADVVEKKAPEGEHRTPVAAQISP